MNSFFVVLLIAACVAVASARMHDPSASSMRRRSSETSASDVLPASNLTLSAYGGLWYEFARSPNVFEFGLKCVTAYYVLNTDGSVGVTNRGIRQYPWINHVSKIHGVATVPNANEPAKLAVKFDGIPRPDNGFTNYWVINTDYAQWAVVYSPPNGPLKPEVVYILTRQQFPSKEVAQAALNELALKTGITVNQLIITDQADCS